MTDIIRDDWICRYQDAGYDALIMSITARYPKIDLSNLTFLINDSGTLPDVDSNLVMQMISDYRTNSFIRDVLVDGNLPAAGTIRIGNPGGVDQDASTIWFTTPNTGTYDIHWFVNGTLTEVVKDADVSTDRSIAKSTLSVSAGDVVQVSLAQGGISGWWARITVN